GMGEDTRANVLGYAASASLGCRAPADTPAMTGTIATLQHIAETMMNRMLQFANDQQWPERSSTLKASLRNVAGQSCWKHEQVLLTRSSTCPWHEPAPERLQPLPWKTALEHSLEQNWEVQLAWPICTEATCAACGSQSQPYLRVASVRRNGVCPVCDVRSLQPTRVVHRIRSGDAISRLSPQQLGLPERHLYWAQSTAV
ncbi:MAG: hypothetical protein ACRYGF_10025, partial [Janthinobacterium lividum]